MGGLSPFMQALGGLGAGVQGFAQGRQFRNDEAMQQQQLQDDRTRNALGTLGILQQLAQTGGSKLTQDPNFQKQLTTTLGQAGINLGGTVPEGFGQTPFSELILKSPEAITALRGLDPATRAQADGSISGLPQGFNDGPAQMDPKEARELYGSLRMTYQMSINAGADPKAPGMMRLQTQMNQLLQGIPGAPSAGDDATPLITGPTKTQVGIQHTQQSTQELIATTANKEAATKWMNTLGPARLANLTARTGLTNEQIQMLPMRVNIAMMNAVAHQQDVELKGQQVAMQVADFQKLGMQPSAVSAYNGIARNMDAMVNQARVAKDSAQKAITTILAQNGGAAPQAPTNANDKGSPAWQAFTAAQGAYQKANNDLYQAQHMTKTFTAKYANIAEQVTKAGMPGSVQHVQNIGEKKPATNTPTGGMKPFYSGAETKDGKPRWLWPDGTYHTSQPPKK